MLTIEASIVVPTCFLIVIILITSTSSLYEDTRKECWEESQLAISRRDSNEVWKYKIFEDENNNSYRKYFSLNPVKLINNINLVNDTKSIFEDNTKILDELKGIFIHEK